MNGKYYSNVVLPLLLFITPLVMRENNTKYNLVGHTTSFISPTNEKISLKNTGDKRDNTDGTTSRTTSSEDGVWQAEIYYKGHAFVKAVLSKR